MTLHVRCPRHHRYSGEKPPRASCLYCISLYQLRLKARAERLEIVERHPKVEADEARA